MTESTDEGGRVPRPQPVTLAPAGTCVLVLDLTERASLAGDGALAFRERLGAFLDRARHARVPIAFTASASERGTPLVPELHRRDDEPLLHPDAFDKLREPALVDVLTAVGCERLVVTGASANNAVMNTVIGAARHLPHDVYVPLDGVYSADPYEFEYAMYHLDHMPSSARRPRFTELGSITWSPAPVRPS